MAEALPAKLVPETITVEFDFSDVLLWGEAIEGASVVVEVLSGQDSNPEELLLGDALVGGAKVWQDIQLGKGGVIYNLVATADGDSSTSYVKMRRLAVLTEGGSFHPGNSLQLTGTLPGGTARVPYSHNLTISGGYEPYEPDGVAAGNAPFWMGFDVEGDQLVCVGIPDETAETSYNFSPQVKDAVNATASSAQSITIQHITASGGVEDGTVGDFGVGSYTSEDGFGAVTFEVLSGDFPPGLTLNDDGTVSGMFSTSGVYSWVVRATDSVGSTADVADTCSVAAVFWWYTFQDPVAVGYRNIWVSEDALSFPVMETPVPLATASGYGAFDLDVGLALVLSEAKSFKRFPDVGDFSESTLEDLPASPKGAKPYYYIDGILFLLPRGSNNYYYSEDFGQTWTAVAAPTSMSLSGISKVNNIWICRCQLDNSQVWFWKSSERVPENWTAVMEANPGGATGASTGWMAQSEQVSISFNNGGFCFRTTNGTDYDAVYTGFNSGDNRDCVYYNGVFVAGIYQDGHIVRSDDQGLTWERIMLGGGGTVLKRVDAAGGRFVASMTDGIWVSTDTGLTWTKATTPHGSSGAQWCGHVRRAPS